MLERGHGSIEERGWQCKSFGGGVGPESKKFTGGRAEIGKQRPKLKSKGQEGWKGKDVAVRMEAKEKLLRL